MVCNTAASLGGTAQADDAFSGELNGGFRTIYTEQ
jgi:hypothetical protein